MNAMRLSVFLLVALLASAPAFAQAPGETQAADVVAKSTGKSVEIKMADGTNLKMFVVMPAKTQKAGVVLVIHDNRGLDDWGRTVADQLARDGFIGIAVDQLSGKAPNGGGTADLGAGVGPALRTVTTADVVARLNAAMAYGSKLPESNGKTGVVGFCWGGSHSWNYASAQPNLNAAVVYYGTPPTDPAAYASIKAPVLGLYGGNDARVNATIDTSKAEMQKLGKSYTPHIFEAAGHGFLRGQAANEANLKAAQAAWPATLAFFREHLK